MKKGFLVLFILLISILPLVYADNIARIADFTNDGQNDFLKFSDRIDTRDSPIELHTLNNTLIQTLYPHSVRQCALSYYDVTRNGYLDIAFSCFYDNRSITQQVLLNSENGFIQSDIWQPNQTYSNRFQTRFGDILIKDFNNDGNANIIDCFSITGSNLSLFSFNGNTFTETDSGIRHPAYPNQLETCYLLPVDFNGDGFLDIITYTYDAQNFTLYKNTRDKTPLFERVTNTTFFNQTFFENKLIKHLASFGEGFQDLYYVAALESDPTNITFGVMENNYWFEQQPTQPTTPTINVSFTFNNSQRLAISWLSQSNRDFFTFSLNSTIQDSANGLTYHLNASYGDTILLAQNPPEVNYDLQARFGNLLNRNQLNLSLYPQCMNIQARVIAPNLIQSNFSQTQQIRPYVEFKNIHGNETIINYIEFCDGRDTNCDGQIDGPFDFTWPDGTVSTIHLDQRFYANAPFFEGQEQSKRYLTFTNPNNSSQVLTFDCQEKINEEGVIFGLRSVNPINNDVAIGGTPIVSQPDTTNDEAIVTNEEQTTTDEETTSEEPQQPEAQSTSFTTLDWEIFTQVDYINQNTRVTQHIQNNRRATQFQIQARVEFPTQILENANLLRTNTRHHIIRQNPIIAFQKDQLEYLERFTIIYTIPGIHLENQIRQIPLTIDSTSQLSDEELAQLDQQREEIATQAIQTNITETRIDNVTEFRISLDFLDGTRAVGEVEIEQYIPKCILEEIDETILRAGIDPKYLNDVRIKEADPIIVWNFKQLDQSQELVLRLEAFRPEDCDDEAKIRTLAGAFILDSFEINQENLHKALLYTFVTILFFLVLFILITRDHYKHENPQVHRLTKLYLHKLHQGMRKEDILLEFRQNSELPEHIQEMQDHLTKKNTHPFFFHVSERSVEIFLFITLLVLNSLEFTGLIPGYIDWFKKIISWMLLLLIFYRVDLTKIFFNHSKQYINISLLIGMFLLHSKSLVAFAQQLFLQDIISFIADLYKFILEYEVFFTIYAFYAGIAILFFCAIATASFIQVREGSFFFLFTTYARPNTSYQYIKRVIKVFLIFLIFQYTIFNRIIEWLAVSIDSAIFILAIIILLTMILSSRVHHTKRIGSIVLDSLTHHVTLLTLGLFYLAAVLRPYISHNTVLYTFLVGVITILVIGVVVQTRQNHFSGLKRISTAVESVYAKFIKLFQHPNTLYLGISGIFVLQLLVEIFLFILPNITGKTSEIYSVQAHQTLFSLFGDTGIVFQQLFGLSLFEQILYLGAYTIALTGNVLLFALPIYIWIVYFTNRGKASTKFSLTDVLQSHSKLASIGRTLIYIALPAILFALASQVLRIQPIAHFGQNAQFADVGVSMSAHLLTWSFTQVATYIGIFVFAILVLYLLSKTLLQKWILYATVLTTFTLSVIIYTIPFIQSQVAYTLSLAVNLSQLSLTNQIIGFTTLFLSSVDIILIYGLGLLLLLYIHMPKMVKRRVISAIQLIKPTRRFFFLSNTMHYLPYYDDVKTHMSGNIVHKVEKYIHRELENHHHPESILLQLKIHQYPDHIIHSAMQAVLLQKDMRVEVEKLHPSSLRIEKVQKLIGKIAKEKRPFAQIYEEYEQSYTHVEIHVAYRLAHAHFHGKLSITQIQKMEVSQVVQLIKKVRELQNQHKSKKEILDTFLDTDVDIEIIVHILDAKPKQTQYTKAVSWVNTLKQKGYTQKHIDSILAQKGWNKEHRKRVFQHDSYTDMLLAQEIVREYEHIIAKKE